MDKASIAKMAIVEEECDEAIYRRFVRTANWMDLLVEAGLTDEKRFADLKAEAKETLSMVVSSIKTARSNK